MPRRYPELWVSAAAVVVVTVVYLIAYRQAGAFPAAYGFVGHGIGILGFVLMLMTELLYSIRKLMADSSWGSMVTWLRFHIVTGLVGPYMVLLHTSMKFRGMAGLVMLLTVVVVVSGVVGRYLYTAVPRPAEEAQPETHARDRRRRKGSPRQALATWRSIHVPLTWALFATAFVHILGAVYYATLLR